MTNKEKEKKDREKSIEQIKDFRPATYSSRVAVILRKLPALTQKIQATAYASEVGESFRPVVNRRIVQTLYGLSIGYVIVDICGRTYCVHDQGSKKMLYFAFDTTLWHLSASLILPAVVVHSIVKYSGKLTKKLFTNKKALAWIPAIVALGSVPFIIKPIDFVTDFTLDNTLRKIYHDKIAIELDAPKH